MFVVSTEGGKLKTFCYTCGFLPLPQVLRSMAFCFMYLGDLLISACRLRSLFLAPPSSAHLYSSNTQDLEAGVGVSLSPAIATYRDPVTKQENYYCSLINWPLYSHTHTHTYGYIYRSLSLVIFHPLIFFIDDYDIETFLCLVFVCY